MAIEAVAIVATVALPSGHVARLCRLDCGVDQALPATHRVEEELGGRQPGEEGVLHEALDDAAQSNAAQNRAVQ